MNTFEITSGAVRATDPCYDMDTWCAGTITDVVNGTWEVEVIRGDEDRVAMIIARHAIHGSNLPAEFIDEELAGDYGVDSGQFGFFDLAKFAEEHDSDYGKPGGFYTEVCNTTSPSNPSLIGPDYLEQTEYTFRGYGVVTCSGYGDGSYPVYVAYGYDGDVIAMMVQFMWDEEEDEVEEAA
jgi:hypothetical protein